MCNNSSSYRSMSAFVANVLLPVQTIIILSDISHHSRQRTITVIRQLVYECKPVTRVPTVVVISEWRLVTVERR